MEQFPNITHFKWQCSAQSLLFPWAFFSLGGITFFCFPYPIWHEYLWQFIRCCRSWVFDSLLKDTEFKNKTRLSSATESELHVRFRVEHFERQCRCAKSKKKEVCIETKSSSSLWREETNLKPTQCEDRVRNKILRQPYQVKTFGAWGQDWGNLRASEDEDQGNLRPSPKTLKEIRDYKKTWPSKEQDFEEIFPS